MVFRKDGSIQVQFRDGEMVIKIYCNPNILYKDMERIKDNIEERLVKRLVFFDDMYVEDVDVFYDEIQGYGCVATIVFELRYDFHVDLEEFEEVFDILPDIFRAYNGIRDGDNE